MNTSVKELVKELDKKIEDSNANLKEAMRQMMLSKSGEVSGNWARLMRDEAKRIADLKATRKEILKQTRFMNLTSVFKS